MNSSKYNSNVIIGAQWGDEGKGKITNYLAKKADIVVRYQGGNNAGHSIIFNKKRFALNHLPSGIFNPQVQNIMAQGMVINPPKLLEEINILKKQGIKNFKLYISDRAHVIMPYHIEIDKANEQLKIEKNPDQAIGTTKKGIGPAYEDKAARIGIRFGDFIDQKSFEEVMEQALLIKNKQLKALNLKTYQTKEIINEYKKYAVELKPFVIETGSFLAKELQRGKKVIFEGAQGVMLCLENGTYPFVTSSSPTASAVPLATGLNHHYFHNVTGIVKAYSSRVGNGAMPSSIEKSNPEIANIIRERGHEYGTVTKRPRRIGWLDIVALNHAARVSGFTNLAITLLDVLDVLEEIKVVYAYEMLGKEIDYIPGSNSLYQKCQPKYLTLPGWKTDTSKITNYDDLPLNAKNYLNTIVKLTNIPIKIFSVGPKSEQTIELSSLLTSSN